MNVIGQIAALHYERTKLTNASDINAIIALYDFFKQGRYDEKIATHKGGISNFLLAGAHSLYSGDYAAAFTQMSAAIREYSKGQLTQSKGFFSQVINNFLLVMAYHLHKADEGRKLAALLKKDLFLVNPKSRPAAWLATYFSTGKLPSQQAVEDYLSGETYKARTRVESYIAMLVARYLHIDVEWPKELPALPNVHILRHELSPWLPLTEEERQQLAQDIGGEPQLSRIRYKQP